ncbi:MAG: transketolase family protein [Candidatus Margulisiibacteriota bacterium]
MFDLAAQRDYYGKTLVALGKDMPNLFVVDADLSSSTRTSLFAKEFPDRFFNVGIAEQNAIGISAGLANMGNVVFVSSFAMFITGRTWDQVRNSVAYPFLNVKIAATHAGLTVGEDGASHQALEDIALMRVIPSMTVLVPADAIEAAQMVRYAASCAGPFYIRMSRGNMPLVYKDRAEKFALGKSDVLVEGRDVSIIACGLMVSVAIEASRVLQKEGISTGIINCSSIRPMDEETIIAQVRKTGAVVTAEEHSVFGGLGSAIAELLVRQCPAPVEMLGVEGVFGESGQPNELLQKHHLTVEGLVSKVKQVLKRT